MKYLLLSLNVAALLLTSSTASAFAGRNAFVTVGNHFTPDIHRDGIISLYSVDKGKTWAVSTTQPEEQSKKSNVLHAVACDSNGLHCVTVGEFDNGLKLIPLSFVSTDGGQNWSRAVTPPPRGVNIIDLYSTTCSNDAERCVAVGEFWDENQNLEPRPLAYTTTDGGQHWQLSPAFSDKVAVLFSVACDSSAQFCTAVGRGWTGSHDIPSAFYSTDGGVSWEHAITQPQPVNDSDNVLKSVACDSSSHYCTAVGSTGDKPISYTSSDGGKNWVSTSVMPYTKGLYDWLSSVSCDSSGQKCTAVGGYTQQINNSLQDLPLAYVSSDGGKSWKISNGMPLVQESVFLHSVRCDSDNQQCIAVGGTICSKNNCNDEVRAFISPDGGKSWTAAKLPALKGSNWLIGAG